MCQLQLERAGASRRVVRERERTGERGRPEPRARVQRAALADRVGDEVVRHRRVGAAVDRDAVGERRRLHGVVVEHVARIGGQAGLRLRPRGERVVAGVAEEVAAHDRVGHADVEVHAVGDLVDDDVAFDRDIAHRTVEPDADLGVLDVQAAEARVAERPADAVDLIGVDALAHIALDREAGQVHVAAAAGRGILSVEADSGVHRAVRRRRRQRRPAMPLKVVYQLPAPSIVTSSTMMWRSTR